MRLRSSRRSWVVRMSARDRRLAGTVRIAAVDATLCLPPLTAEQIRALPATVDVPTAGRCYGIGRTTAYELARSGEFPVKVLRLGTKLRVVTAAIMADLDISSGSASEVAR